MVDPSSPVPSTQQIDHEKQLSNISSLSNPGNTVPQQSGPIVQSLADFTPGISSSSMLDGKINATERPLDYLLRMVSIYPYVSDHHMCLISFILYFPWFNHY